MLKTLYKISTYLIIALGIIHLSFTPFAYSRFTLNTAWFMGTGLASIFLGFLNLVSLRNVGEDRVVRWLCLIANLILASFFALVVIVVPDARMPQAYIALLLLVYSSVATFLLGRVESNERNG